MITKEELKNINVDFSDAGVNPETGDFDIFNCEMETEFMEEFIRSTIPNGAEYKGEYTYSKWAGGKTKTFVLKYTTEELITAMKKEGARGSLPLLKEGKLILPMEDLGGGIVTKMVLEYVGDVE